MGRLRADVGRRDRIVEAALWVISQHGVGGLTHRAIATRAGIPLGSTTYHFAKLEDILEAAFKLAMDRDTARLNEWAGKLDHESDLPAELVGLVEEQGANEGDALRVNFELALAAVRHPRLRVLGDQWTMLMASLVEPYVGVSAARTVSAVYEGTVFRLIVGGSIDRDTLADHFRRACSEVTQPSA